MAGDQHIVEAAIEVFGSKGFTGSSMRDVADRAGVSAPSIYHHFDSKAALYKAVVANAIGRYDEQVERAMDRAGSARDKLLAFYQATLTFAASESRLTRLVYRARAQMGDEPEIESMIREGNRCVIDDLARLFAEACPDDLGPESAQRAAVLFITQLEGLCYELVFDEQATFDPQLGGYLLELLLATPTTTPR